MRLVLATIFLGAALWQAAIDWQATIGQGYAYRFRTLGGLIGDHWPESYAGLVEGLKASAMPFAWYPVGAAVMAVPVALLLAIVALGLWVTRDRRRRAR